MHAANPCAASTCMYITLAVSFQIEERQLWNALACSRGLTGACAPLLKHASIQKGSTRKTGMTPRLCWVACMPYGTVVTQHDESCY